MTQQILFNLIQYNMHWWKLTNIYKISELRTKMTKHMHIMGQNVLNSATVLQSKNSPRMYMSNVPILIAVLPSEPRDPLSLGSDISPTYDDVDPAPNPVLNPISKVDTHNNTDECAQYSSTHPKILGTFASIIHRFFPNLSCRIPDSRHPTGWIMNNKLPVKSRMRMRK